MKSYRDSDELTVKEQAVYWLCELADESVDRRAAFVSWLRESPRHVEEFLLTTTLWKELDHVGPQGHIDLEEILREVSADRRHGTVMRLTRSSTPVSNRAASPWRSIKRSWKLAAGIAALTLGSAWTVYQISDHSKTYTTAMGEQRAFRLADGSILHLNTRSRVQVRFSEHARELRLLDGEALFTVARDAHRPFRVNAGGNVIQALGTEFNVYRKQAEVTVSVIEGLVQISPGSKATAPGNLKTVTTLNQPLRLAAGDQASFSALGKLVKQNKTDVGAIAWRERHLVFRAAPLEQIAAEFARYSPRRIRVEGEAARNRRLTASFAADDPDSLILFLQKMDDLTVETHGSEFIVKER